MSNVPSWLSRWARSPRQDRRVVENGKFVELGQVHVPEPPPVEEQVEVNTALEVVHEPVNAGTGADGNVSLDAQNGPSEVGHGSSEPSNETDRSTETGVVQPVSDSTVSSPEGQSVSEISQAELEPIDAVAEHEKGSQTIAEIAQALEPLPGDVLTEEKSDALAEVLRLPEPTENNDIPF